MKYDVGQPRLYNYNLNIQRELPGRIVVRAGYLGTRGQELMAGPDRPWGRSYQGPIADRRRRPPVLISFASLLDICSRFAYL